MLGGTRRRGAATCARALLAACLVVAAIVLPAGEAGASSEWIDAERRFLGLLNEERADQGLPAMEVSLQMVRIARDWSETMALEDTLYHRPELQTQVFGPWQSLGENVGRAGHTPGAPTDGTVDRLHQAFMDSPPHRANVLGDFNQVGVGVRVAEEGTLWVTFNFLKGPVGEFPLFEDIGGNAHEGSTERAWIGDLAQGCSFAQYCPERSVSRAQMATFLSRALGLEPVAADRFVDVDPGSPHAGFINALVDAGIAAGCAEDRYCPEDPVTRAQMATFLGRALELAPQELLPRFVDVLPGSTHYGYVNAVADAGVTAGCDSTGTRYCPDDPVRRDQMATFLARAFELPEITW